MSRPSSCCFGLSSVLCLFVAACGGKAAGDVTGSSGHAGDAGNAAAGEVAVGGDAGDSGAGGTMGGSSGFAGSEEVTCAAPLADECPDGLSVVKGRQPDFDRHCWKAEVGVSCTAGGSDANTCWADSETGDIFELAVIPCKPDAKWRDCTPAEKDSLDDIRHDCDSIGPDGGALICAVPKGSTCPTGSSPFDGGEVDFGNHCLKPSVPLSCSSAVDPGYACWVDSDSGAVFLLGILTCKPDPKWRDCTDSEWADAKAALSKEHPVCGQ